MAKERHERDLVVWDVPATIEPGSLFRIRIGAKCSAACRPHGWQAEVRDHEGRRVAAAAFDETTWPATEGLYCLELPLRAPEQTGQFAWQVVIPAEPPEPPESNATPVHAERQHPLPVRTVPAADCRLRLIAVDRVSQAPVAGARVAAHPYRTVTDAAGVAELRLPSGRYRLFVSGTGYFPFRSDAELSADVTLCAELEHDLGPSDAELWS